MNTRNALDQKSDPFLATALGAAQSLVVRAKSKKPAMQALMESATTMLKNGATPAVVDFAEETLNEVSGVVIPAIINESENDQRFIYSLHSRFQVIRDALAEDNQNVFQLNAEEQTLSGQHKHCRDMLKHLKEAEEVEEIGVPSGCCRSACLASKVHLVCCQVQPSSNNRGDPESQGVAD